MSTEAERLKRRLEELEKALTQLKTEKDEETQQLRNEAEEARANLELEQKRSASLEQELRSAALQAELDRHRALDTLRAEHQRTLEREQKLVEEEKKRAHDWITDLKSGFELEKRSFQEKISQFEEKLKTSESKSADPASTTPPEGDAHDTGSGERSTDSSAETPPTDPAAPTDASRGATTERSSTESTPSTGSAAATSSGDALMKSMTELIKVQMQAMTKAASVQSLPPLDRFTGEGSQADDDSIDRWLERFDERAHLAEWSDEVKLYQLKVHLDKTALHVFRMFPTDDKSSYKKASDALRKRFRPVDIEELRGLEFHRKVQEDESVEQLGLELQRLGRKAYPSTDGKDFDRLLKGRFFQALLTKWQRKLGAPKPSETFQELYDRARTLEQHEKQYNAASVTVHGEKKNEKLIQPKQNKLLAKPPQNKELSATSPSTKQKDDSESRPEQSPSVPGRYNLRGYCHKCGNKGHLARNCRNTQSKQEAPGRAAPSDGSKAASVKTVESIPAEDEFTEAQLEDMLAKCRLRNEQKELGNAYANTCTITTESKESSQVVGPTLFLDLEIEGVPVEAVVDCGSPATIISRSMLHEIARSLRRAGKPSPQISKPSIKVYGKDGKKSGHELVCTAQLEVTIQADGQTAHVPVIVQPDSEQACLLGTNATSLLGLKFLRANNKPLRAGTEPKQSVTCVRLVRTISVPSQASKIVKAEIESIDRKGEHCVFEPDVDVMESSGLSIPDTVLTIGEKGRVYIPLQNLQSARVKLHRGAELGVIEPFVATTLNDDVTRTCTESQKVASSCAKVTVEEKPNDERKHKLLEALKLERGDLTTKQFSDLKAIMLEASDVFALDNSELGCTSLVKHTIDTGDNPPIKQQPYRTPMIYRERMAKMIEDMQAQGIVQPSSSPWASPVVLVPKKDGTARFCIDYRRLNAVSRKDVYPLPRIEDILSTLGEAKYFSTLDLATGFWQIELDESSRPKSAFTTHKGLYEFVRMPFGLCNAPATFQRLMQVVLAGLEWSSCFVYIDDILVASRSFEEHLSHIKEVFSRLRKAGLCLKPKKCSFLCDQVVYLGHVISKKGIAPDPAKVQKVRDFPAPTDVSKLRQFLGLASYYRRFVPAFAKIAAPLHSLTKKSSTFCWTCTCDTAFCKLKELLCDAPVLAYPRFGPSEEFVIETDASTVGLGAVLAQKQPDGTVHPIAYASRSLQPAERNYGISELETLGLVWAVKHFRPYILGYPCTVYTDHAACLSLLSSRNPSTKLARWALTIQEMNLTIKHRSGKKNANADALSRNPTDKETTVLSVTTEHLKDLCENTLPPEAQRQFDDIKQEQRSDPDLLPMIEYLESGKLPAEEQTSRKIVIESPKFELIDGVLYFEYPSSPHHWCIVVPKHLRQTLLEEAHSGQFAGHFAEKKVYDRFRRYYWWKGIRSDVRRHCRGCLTCATRKGGRKPTRPPLHPIPVGGPFHRLGVDVLQLPLTRNGNRYVIVFADYLTKWIEAFPVPDQTAETIAKLLVEKIVCVHGVPEQLLSDRGANFLSDLVLEVCSLLGIEKLNTSGYHPQTDGLVEKFNSTLISMISKSSTRSDDWDERLPFLLFAYRVSAQESTKESPFYLLFGRNPRLPTESTLTQPRSVYTIDLDDYKTALISNLGSAWEAAKTSIQSAQNKQKLYYDQKSKQTSFNVGDRVLVYMPNEVKGKDWKLKRPFHGPYCIISLTDCNAEVQLLDGKEESIFVSLDRVRPCPSELSNDVCWTGHNKKHSKRQKSHKQSSQVRDKAPVRTVGPVTRSTTHNANQ